MEPRLPEGVHALTDRQREVAELVAQGLTNAEIGDRLGISRDGAKYHVSEVLTRLNLERREQIREWVVGRPAKRSRRAFAGLALAFGAFVGAAIAVAVVSADLIQPPSGPAGPSPVATETAIERPGEQEPNTEGDQLSEPELLALLHQPLSWDHPDYAMRVPPPSIEAVKRERAVYANGYEFSGTLPSVFGSNLPSDASCENVAGGVGRAHSGDWVLVASDRASVDARFPVGQRAFTLYPSDPALLEELSNAAQPLRLRAIDQDDWLATHLLEVAGSLEPDADGERAYQFTFESPRTADWLAVVTAGPLWGCFTFDLERDAASWPASVAEVSAADVPTGAAGRPDAGDALDAFLTHFGGVGNADRVCVDATAGPNARSGEIALARMSGQPRLIEYRHHGPAFWLPRYVPNDGALEVRSALVTPGVAEPVHTTRALETRAPTSFVSHNAVDEVILESSGYGAALVLPRAGIWIVVATATPTNWGCFTLDVADSPGLLAWARPPVS